MRRFELTDGQRKLIEPVLPRQRRGGRWNDHRQTLDGMLWVLRCGLPWRDMPERYGCWTSVYFYDSADGPTMARSTRLVANSGHASTATG